MLKRLLSALMLLGVLQGADGTWAAEDDTDERMGPAVVQVVNAPAPATAHAALRNSVHGRWPHESISVDRDESLWLAGPATHPCAAAMMRPLGALTMEVAVSHDGSAESSAAVETLLANVLDQCRNAGMLKVVVETDRAADQVASIAARRGFMFNRQGHAPDGPSLEFYTNLYFQPSAERDGEIS